MAVNAGLRQTSPAERGEDPTIKITRTSVLVRQRTKGPSVLRRVTSSVTKAQAVHLQLCEQPPKRSSDGHRRCPTTSTDEATRLPHRRRGAGTATTSGLVLKIVKG